MARSMYRKAMWFRVATLCLALVFVVGFTGIGAAVPAPDGDAGTRKGETREASPPDDKDAKPARESSSEAPAEEMPAPEAPADEAPAPEVAVSTEEVVTAVPAPIVAAPSLVTEPTASRDADLQIDFEGWHSSGAWTDGNLGSYDEGDWVAYRIVIRNKSAAPTYLPAFAVAYDYYLSTKDAIGLDKTKEWNFYAGSVPSGLPSPFPGVSITPSSDPDGGMPSTIPGDLSKEHVVDFNDSAVSGLVVPGDGYAVIYFKAHLSITAWWLQQTPSHNGCSAYPGSSTQIRLSGMGRQTLPWPVPPAPTGQVVGLKFYDEAPLGAYGGDPGAEPGLPGWVFNLADGSPGFPFYLTATSDAEGQFMFGPLPTGEYALTESISPPWASAYPATIMLMVAAEGITTVEVGNYVDVAPAIDVAKTASRTKVVAGDTVTYTYVVTNVGDTALDQITAVDDKISLAGVTIPALGVGESYTFEVSGAISVDTTNRVDVEGHDAYGHVVSDWDTATVTVVMPGVEIDKTVNHEHILSGGAVEYTYLVTNTGDSDLMDVHVTDDKLGDIGMIGSLAAGASATLTASTTLAVDTHNIGTVMALDEFENPYSDTDDAMVWVHNPSISIVKSADPGVIMSGENVTYTYLVTNTGDITLYNISVEDDILGPIGIIPMLAPGASDTVQTIEPIDADVVNVGTATGWYGEIDSDFYGYVDDTSSAAVDVIDPSISIVKTPSMSRIVLGSEVTYTYTITNTGDVTLFDVETEDDKLGALGVIAELAPGEVRVIERTVELTETTVNIVTTTGMDMYEHVVSDLDEATVEVVDPDVSIVKTAAPTVILSGEDVTYTYLVTNTGDYPLDTLVVDDDVLGAVGTIPLLAPGESDTLSLVAAVAVDTTNVATVTAHFGWIDPASQMAFDGWLEASDDAFVDVVGPAISLVKDSDAPALGIPQGEDTAVTYSYVVTNIGDVTLFDTMLVDDKLGDIADMGTLAVGESKTIEVTAILSPALGDGNIVNIATVTAIDAQEHPVSDQDTHAVETFLPFTPPDMALVKSADRTTAKPDDVITYTLTWTNVGEGASLGFDIVDTFDDTYLSVIDSGGGTVNGNTITWVFDGAAPGESGSVTYKLQVAATMPQGTTYLDNVAVVTDPTDENPDNNKATWRVKVGEPFLPFTGSEFLLLFVAALGLGTLGLMMRRLSYGTRA